MPPPRPPRTHSQHDDPSRRRRAYERERARRQRELRKRRQRALLGTVAGIAAIVAAIAFVALPALKGTSSPSGTGGLKTVSSTGTSTSTSTTTSTSTSKPPPPPKAPFAVGITTMHLVDSTRTVTYANGTTGPRVLTTEVRYPAVGAAGGRAIPNATPESEVGPYPLIVFGHGFELLPVDYHTLLNAWASAGYVVAAPIFPAENHNAPGGPDRNDLPNEPGDMKFVIAEMLAASSSESSALRGLIEPEEIAVAGHSDGGDTALAVAYDEYQGIRDPVVKAAVILSGAEMEERFLPKFSFPAGGPALLAMQGNLDGYNRPWETTEYFDAAKPPKYLLELIGTGHIEPYTYAQPWLGVVERVSIDFLNRYLKAQPGSLHRMIAAAKYPGKTNLVADQ